MKATLLVPAALLPVLLTGCHPTPSLGDPAPPFIVTINNQGPPIRQVEVDYPNASFGRDQIASGASITYPPKLTGTGPVKITYTDVSGKSHSAVGPTVQDGVRENLVISIGEDNSIIFEAEPNPR
jgi:hypothetical protein